MLHLFGFEISLSKLIMLSIVAIFAFNTYQSTLSAIDQVKYSNTHIVK